MNLKEQKSIVTKNEDSEEIIYGQQFLFYCQCLRSICTSHCSLLSFTGFGIVFSSYNFIMCFSPQILFSRINPVQYVALTYIYLGDYLFII